MIARWYLHTYMHAYFTNSQDRYVCMKLFGLKTLKYKQLVYDGSDKTGTVCADMG